MRDFFLKKRDILQSKQKSAISFINNIWRFRKQKGHQRQRRQFRFVLKEVFIWP